MEVIEVIPGIPYDHPVELPVSRSQPVSKHIARKGAGNGVKRPKNTVTIPGKLRVELAVEARRITEENRTIMVLGPTGKKKFVRLSEHRKAEEDAAQARPAA